MCKFLTELDVRRVNGEWVVDSPLIFESDVAGRAFTVPAGFSTDFASVPRVPIIYALMGDLNHAAATLHDFLYRSSKTPRKVADRVFLEASKASGFVGWKAYAMYIAVRLVGGIYYKE